LHRHVLIVLFLSTLLTACSNNPYPEGKKLYQQKCQNCHGADGNGIEKLMPPLNNSHWMANHQDKLPCIIKLGMGGKITVNGTDYNRQMPANEKLTEFEIANIINYINHAWDNDLPFRSPEWVQEKLNNCKE